MHHAPLQISIIYMIALNVYSSKDEIPTKPSAVGKRKHRPEPLVALGGLSISPAVDPPSSTAWP